MMYSHIDMKIKKKIEGTAALRKLRHILPNQTLKRRTFRSETILATESPLKTMKNAFYFTLKALFVWKMFKFLSWLFGHVEKRLD